jgi:putative peptide zinc metalloprotease protein
VSAAGTIRADSVVVFPPLARRVDGLEVVIGPSGSDVFVALPLIGAEAIDMLGAGASVGEVEDRIAADTGDRIDVGDLVATLVALGMVAEVDGRSLPSGPPARVTLPWLRPRHVRWMLHAPVQALLDAGLAVLVLASLALAVRADAPFPSAASLLWSDNGSLVLATQVVIGWTLILVHEAAHLITARAAGVPGYVGFGTRLQFLVAQTNVTGIWAAPRRHRIAVYTAGMRADLAVGALALLASTRLAPGGVPHRLALVVAVLAATGLAAQLLIFMRTDVYFIVQDLTRSRNLYGDSAAYTRHLGRRLVPRGRAAPEASPLDGLGARERRVVKGYTALLVTGTGVCLGYAAIVLVPFGIGLLHGAVVAVASTRPEAVLDGLVVLAVQGALLTIWSRAWWARHGHRLRRRVTEASSPR